jgi:metal transporter CNNM
MLLTDLLYTANEASAALTTFVKRDTCNATTPKEALSPTLTGVFGALVPILVLLSGLFAGLTLGYMSLDETQLHVLSISGTE